MYWQHYGKTRKIKRIPFLAATYSIECYVKIAISIQSFIYTDNIETTLWKMAAAQQPRATYIHLCVTFVRLFSAHRKRPVGYS